MWTRSDRDSCTNTSRCGSRPSSQKALDGTSASIQVEVQDHMGEEVKRCFIFCNWVFTCVAERSTLAKPIPRVQTRSILSTRPSALFTANQHWPTKSQSRAFTCLLLTCITSRQKSILMVKGHTQKKQHIYKHSTGCRYLGYLHLFEVPVGGGSRVVMPDVNPPHWAQAVCCTKEFMNGQTRRKVTLSIVVNVCRSVYWFYVGEKWTPYYFVMLKVRDVWITLI